MRLYNIGNWSVCKFYLLYLYHCLMIIVSLSKFTPNLYLTVLLSMNICIVSSLGLLRIGSYKGSYKCLLVMLANISLDYMMRGEVQGDRVRSCPHLQNNAIVFLKVYHVLFLLAMFNFIHCFKSLWMMMTDFFLKPISSVYNIIGF